MLKGLSALFSSKLILNPMVFLGIVLGTFLTVHTNQDFELVLAFFKQPIIYALALVLAFLHNIIFHLTYKEDGFSIDYAKMFWQIVGSALRFVLSTIMTFLFIYMLSFGGDD